MIPRFTLILLVGSLLTTPLAAQEPARRDAPRSVPRLTTGGLLGGAVGLAVGGVAGAWIGSNYCSDEGDPDSCRPVQGMVYGAVAGESLGMPLGVHLANGRRGDLLPAVLASAALGAGGAVILMHADSDLAFAAVAIGIPLLQLVTSVLVERATTGR